MSLAKSLATLRDQVNRLEPTQRKQLESALATIRSIGDALPSLPEDLKEQAKECVIDAVGLYMAGRVHKVKEAVAAEFPEFSQWVGEL